MTYGIFDWVSRVFVAKLSWDEWAVLSSFREPAVWGLSVAALMTFVVETVVDLLWLASSEVQF